MDVGTPWDQLPSNPSRVPDLAKLLAKPPSPLGIAPKPLLDQRVRQWDPMMGTRASADPPVADLQFTATPELYNPGAAQEAHAFADGLRHDDSPVPQMPRNVGEPATDPAGAWDAQQAIGRFAPKPSPTTEQLMRLLAAGQGQEA